MEKIKAFIENHIVDIVCITAFIFFVLGCWCLYTANRTTNDYHDVTDTVQQVEADNRSARQQIGNASEQIKHAQNKLNGSIKRADEVAGTVKQAQRRIDRNTAIVDDCERIITAGQRDTEEARGIFADIDERNKISGTQADSHA